VTFVIEIPTVGGYYSKSSVITSRLYPYINSWDYLVLAGQLIFIMLTSVRNVLLIYEAWQMKSKCLKSISFWATVFSILLSSIVLSVRRRFTDFDYPFGIFWPLYCLFFVNLRILITSLCYLQTLLTIRGYCYLQNWISSLSCYKPDDISFIYSILY
jgi:hypothetical protein